MNFWFLGGLWAPTFLKQAPKYENMGGQNASFRCRNSVDRTPLGGIFWAPEPDQILGAQNANFGGIEPPK